MIQVRLWNDCYNNCTFCSLAENKKITSINDKKARISKLIELEDDKIGIIGGEFFEGQLLGCEEEWIKMISKISCDKLIVTANLINRQYMLEETIKARPDILICTSYDTIGRFKSTEQKEQWLDRVNKLPNVFCTVIPTQELLSDTFIDKIKCGINICEPHLGIEWYKLVKKDDYHDILIRENKIFNLPKRIDFLKWIAKYPNILANAKNYKATHFNDILSFNKDNNFIYEVYDRFNDSNNIAKCGHPYFARCYADSDRCLECDLEEL